MFSIRIENYFKMIARNVEVGKTRIYEQERKYLVYYLLFLRYFSVDVHLHAFF